VAPQTSMAVALVLTVIGTGITSPLTVGFGLWLLWVMPITWLVIYVTVRSAAKFLPDMFFPTEKQPWTACIKGRGDTQGIRLFNLTSRLS
jgi:hypothetical protein